ncbi:unnamed protein product [Oppiella nova]|uniref:Uncharacterized protein n=1 Tax=Oppiella nova TaxID=334625 RepID=A0A7R9QNU6_9ACAR|nr:unnamed protein product [Oppiella nova]CAG2168955.1 unnamed protein product [Oppiella nova]
MSCHKFGHFKHQLAGHLVYLVTLVECHLVGYQEVVYQVEGMAVEQAWVEWVLMVSNQDTISALTIPEIYAQAPAAIERLRDKGDNVSADELDDLVVKLKQDQEALRIAAGIFPPDENLLNYIIGLMQTHQKRAEVLIKLSNQL